MRLLARFLTACLLLLLAAVGLVWGKYYRAREDTRLNDVMFESSDGVWMDFTNNWKGRDFNSVVWTFETYRILENKPEVTMIRITDRKEGAKELVEWKVPRGVSSGKARPYLSPITADQEAEILRRTKVTVQSLEKK